MCFAMVNQRAVVEEIWRGHATISGLKQAPRRNLCRARLERPSDSLLVLNGFKDQEFIELAFAGARCGKKVVIVIEN